MPITKKVFIFSGWDFAVIDREYKMSGDAVDQLGGERSLLTETTSTSLSSSEGNAADACATLAASTSKQARRKKLPRDPEAPKRTK